MALVKCSECGKEVSDKAGSCPSCGAPVAAGIAERYGSPHSTAAKLAKVEETVYDKAGVLVTTTRVVFPSCTYATANITSVAVRDRVEMPDKSLPKVLIGGGSLLFLIGLASSSGGAVVFGICLLVGGIFWLTQLENTNYYTLVVGNAGAEKQGLESTDAAYIQEVANALNEAIIKRG